MIHLLNGKEYSERLYEKYKEYIDKNNIDLTLAVLQIGDNKASNTYIKNKQKACEKVGIHFQLFKTKEDVTPEVLHNIIYALNNDDNIHGILVQRPLPEHISDEDVYIVPNKDVDMFADENVVKLVNGDSNYSPCTPKGICKLLEEYNIDVSGKNVVIVGRSKTVGLPLALQLLHKDATVTICHSKTKNLKNITRSSDILVTAIGKPKMIDHNYIGDNTHVIVDVGINRDENGKLCGDCDFDSIIDRWKYLNENFDNIPDKYITPVPGGIGPMTVVSVITNLLRR